MWEHRRGEFIYLVWHVDGRSGGEKYLDDFIVTVCDGLV